MEQHRPFSCTLPGIFCCLIVSTAPLSSQAESGLVDIGFRADVELANGTPANDILGGGVYGHYRLGNGLLLGAALDHMVYDFESPASVAGIKQDGTVDAVDASATATNLTAWLGPDSKDWYWRAGLGIGLVDVGEAGGPKEGGGTFHMTTDAGTEYLLLLGGGLRYPFSQHWALDSYVGVIHHIADWKVTDTESGRTGKVSDYTTFNFQIGLAYTF